MENQTRKTVKQLKINYDLEFGLELFNTFVKISLISYFLFLLLLFFICILGLAHMFFIINTTPLFFIINTAPMCIFYAREINLNLYLLYIQ